MLPWTRRLLLCFDEDLGAGFDLIIRLADDLIAFLQAAGNLDQACKLFAGCNGYLDSTLIFHLKYHLATVPRRHRRRRYGQKRLDVSPISARSWRKKSNLRAHLRQHALVVLLELDFHHDRCLGTIRRGHDIADVAGIPLLWIGIQSDLTVLLRCDACDVRFGNIGVDFQRRHVGDGHDCRFRACGAGQWRNDLADVGVLFQYRAVERRDDSGIVYSNLGFSDGEFGGIDGSDNPFVTCFGYIVFRLRYHSLLEQGAHALRVLLRVVEVRFGDTEIFPRALQASHDIRIVQPSDHLSFLDPVTLFHGQINQRPRSLGGHRGFTPCDHVAAGGQDRIG